MTKNYKFIVIEKKVNFALISSLHKKIESYNLDDCLLIYKLYKDDFKDALNESDIPKIKSIQDVYNLDDPNKIAIEELIKKTFEEAIENIIVPCLNIDFLSSKIEIEDCGTFVNDKKLFIVTHRTAHYSYFKNKVNNYLYLDLLNRFLF